MQGGNRLPPLLVSFRKGGREREKRPSQCTAAPADHVGIRFLLSHLDFSRDSLEVLATSFSDVAKKCDCTPAPPLQGGAIGHQYGL